MRLISGCLCVIALLVSGAVTHAEPKVQVKVNCVYPGETLGGALGDLAAQLGYAFVAGDLEDSGELDDLIWVHARGVSPETACLLIGQSAGVSVQVDDANRRVSAGVDALQPVVTVRAFRVDALCAAHCDYTKRFGPALQEGGEEPVYAPNAAGELRDAVAEILHLEGAPGSAIGKRLVYTRTQSELDRISELLRLLEGHGESAALQADRQHRAKLSAQRSDFSNEEMLVSAMLWQLFKEFEAPVYIDRVLMESFDLESDTTDVSLTRESTHYDALLELAREHGFAIDSRNGALRLHADTYEGASGYRVFDVSTLLAELEAEYADFKTGASAEGYNGDLSSEGGVLVVVEALALQLENAGCAPLVLAFGSRVVVVGGVEAADRAAEVLTAIGWTEEKK